MARVKVKGVAELSSKLRRDLRIVLNKMFRDKQLRLKVGRIIEADIKDNVNFGGAADQTILTRDYLKQYNKTDPAYIREDVKLVFSGKLLNDLATSVKGFPTKQTFEIAHSKKSHPGYKTANGRTDKIPYIELSEYLINDLGYDYIQISEDAQEQIVNLVRDSFFDLLI